MKKNILFISCEEAHHICDKKQYGEATRWERFKLALRYSWCHITRSYTDKNNKLTKVMDKSKVQCLKDNELNRMKAKFEAELGKYQ